MEDIEDAGIPRITGEVTEISQPENAGDSVIAANMEIETLHGADEQNNEEEREISSNSAVVNYYWDYQDISTNNTDLKILANSSEEFSPNNILKGCKWAPDGSCVLTNSDDNVVRLFNLPDSLCRTQNWKEVDANNDEWNPVLNVKEGGPVYDFCWFPLMNSMDPATSCFITAAGDAPVHLFDAFDGHLRGTYLTFNHLEQIVAPHSVTFDQTGSNIYCGFKNSIKIFHTTRPGKEFTERKLKTSFIPDLNQCGIISCFAFNPCSTIYACGSFQKTVALYLDDGTVMAILNGHRGGVTHLQFSHDGTKLYSGGRKDNRLICWDIRNLTDEYQIFERVVETNQRIYFDITKNDRYLVTGQTSGMLLVLDITTHTSTDATRKEFKVSNDSINGVSVNPFLPILATSSGQRHFFDIAEDSDDDECFVKSQNMGQHSLSLWKFL